MLKHMRDCRRITELISLSQEQPLSTQEQLKVKMHLAICPMCRAFEQNNQMLKEMIQEHKKADKDSSIQTPPQ